MLSLTGLDGLLGVLAGRGYTVVGPTVRDGAITLDEVGDVSDMPRGWTDEQEAGIYRLRRRGDDALFGYAVGPQSPRRYLSPPRRTMWSATRSDDDGFTIDEPPPPRRYAFVGMRACELAAVAVQDHVLRDGRFPDPAYTAAREGAFFVAVNCAEPARTCFCTSMGTGPEVRAGHDLALTELIGEGRHEFLVEAGSEIGAEVLAEVLGQAEHRAATTDDMADKRDVVEGCVEQMTRRLDPHVARDVLAANPGHPRWDDVASRCLSCTNCTLVCPTCFCSTTEDVTSLRGDHAERVQRWDSCFTLDHSYLHGAGSVRRDVSARYRQWLTHKLSTWWDQFGESGCVGCGRCIAWCPAAIDITEEVAAIAATGEH